ncbi:Cob(I)yrinic acid a,c-diamide adenosyltransferase [Poriferisphaera corsica]|uniref:Corrinoid adenosyltransferase n=1 Tax=Poriferisphaera corsica TaxID=2528020 RepID=A0A517YTI5_9BACT|nr:cob(I)yrinic acid a,c-diamide adenosyltransferase [Poriferisphaera corsica]QDU33537.1 Cob(I)yrinic acid a,c-diamide adenosyltransferase [Poriferisphaera corsica]
MKLYTKTGDDGTTGLLGNHRIGKDALRVEAYGTSDELNAFIGHALIQCADSQDPQIKAIFTYLSQVQSRLFDLGSQLASPPIQEQDSEAETKSKIKAAQGIPTITDEIITEMEAELDRVCADLPPMKYFILPGGSELAARLHIARTVCRRTERLTVALSRIEPVDANLIKYLNRLSDLLFAYARKANQLQNIPDTPWLGRNS